MEKRMANQMKKIKMTEEMRIRIIQKCIAEIELDKEKEDMKKNVISNFKKPAIIAATLAVCFCLTGITALATTGKGFFQDKTNWNGAITGETYENATGELAVSTIVKGNVLMVTVDMVKPNVAPYNAISEMRIETAQILNEDGTVVVADIETGTSAIENSNIKFSVPVEQLTEGTYKLVISSFVGEKKAEQPLEIKGNWEYEFVK